MSEHRLGSRSKRRGGGPRATVCLCCALLAGCGQGGGRAVGGSRRAALEQERAAVERQRADTLAKIREYEALDLDRRLELVGQQAAMLKGKHARAGKSLASIQARKKALFRQMEAPTTTGAAGSDPDSPKEWADRLQSVRMLEAEVAINCVSIERQLHMVREEQAGLGRKAAYRDILIRQGEDQQRRLDELSELLRDPPVEPADRSEESDGGNGGRARRVVSTQPARPVLTTQVE